MQINLTDHLRSELLALAPGCTSSEYCTNAVLCGKIIQIM